MANYIVGFILFVVIGYVSYYIYKQKKKGVQCIGCSCANSCQKGTCKTRNQNSVNMMDLKIHTNADKRQ